MIVVTIKAKLCNAVSERIISLLESLLRNCISFSQFPAHTDGLRALAREQKGSGETTRRRSCHIARFVLGAYGRRSSRPVQPRQPFFNGVIDASFSELCGHADGILDRISVGRVVR